MITAMTITYTHVRQLIQCDKITVTISTNLNLVWFWKYRFCFTNENAVSDYMAWWSDMLNDMFISKILKTNYFSNICYRNIRSKNSRIWLFTEPAILETSNFRLIIQRHDCGM